MADRKRGRGSAERRTDRKPAGARPKQRSATVHLPDDIVKELRATARPGKGELLVQVFAQAATAFAEGDLREAARLGDQAKHMALRAAVPRELLGQIHYHSGRYKEAASELSAFRRLSGSTEQNPMIADSYRALGKPEKALEFVDEIDRRAVDEAVFYEGVIVGAGALADQGRLDEAIMRVERLDLEPANAAEHHLRAWYVLGDLLERKGRFTQARAYFEAVAAADSELTDAPERAQRLGGR